MNVLNGTPHVPRAHPRAPRYTAARQAIDPLVGLMVGLMGALVAMAGEPLITLLDARYSVAVVDAVRLSLASGQTMAGQVVT